MGNSEFKTHTLSDVPCKFRILNKEGQPSILTSNIPTYLVTGDVPYLIGLNQQRFWKAKIDTFDEVVEIFPEGREEGCSKILAPRGTAHHMRVDFLSLKEDSLDKSVVFLIREAEEEIKIHHVNQAHQMMTSKTQL